MLSRYRDCVKKVHFGGCNNEDEGEKEDVWTLACTSAVRADPTTRMKATGLKTPTGTPRSTTKPKGRPVRVGRAGTPIPQSESRHFCLTPLSVPGGPVSRLEAEDNTVSLRGCLRSEQRTNESLASFRTCSLVICDVIIHPTG